MRKKEKKARWVQHKSQVGKAWKVVDKYDLSPDEDDEPFFTIIDPEQYRYYLRVPKSEYRLCKKPTRPRETL